jgi:hypothetical protein
VAAYAALPCGRSLGSQLHLRDLVLGRAAVTSLPAPFVPAPNPQPQPTKHAVVGPNVTLAGNGWYVVPSPSLTNVDNDLASVSAASPSDAWAVGGQRDAETVWHPLVEHWDGRSWTVAPFPSAADAGSELLHAITARSDSNVYATGQDGTAFPEKMVVGHFNGSQWSLRSCRRRTSAPTRATTDSRASRRSPKAVCGRWGSRPIGTGIRRR